MTDHVPPQPPQPSGGPPGTAADIPADAAEAAPADVAEAPAADDPFAVVADAVDGMREELAALGDQFRRRLLNDREARRGLDVLHEELGRARGAAEGRSVQPLLYDLVLLLDRVERQAATGDPFADSVRAELAVVLDKYGMTRVPPVSGPFDPGTQEAVGTVPAPAPEDDGLVAEIVRHGYRMADRIVRPQQVLVYAAARPFG